MTDQVRLLDGPLSEGLETATALVRCSKFSVELGKYIRQPGGAERGVLAMCQEFFSPPQIVTAAGNGGPYRSAPGEVLPPDHFIVPCRYAKLPSMDMLKKTFTGGVSSIFDGRVWGKYSLCINASEVPGDRIMLRKRFDRRMKSEEVIAWGNDYQTEFAPNGYRPTMGHHEVPDFHRANPELCKEGRYVGLGSFAFGDDSRRLVAVLDALNGRPILDGRWFDDGGRLSGLWFLFVRK